MNIESLVTNSRDEFLPLLAAELTDAAYQVALQFGVTHRWCEFELQLWMVLTKVLEQRLLLEIPTNGAHPATVKHHSIPNRIFLMPNGHTPIHDGFLPIGEKLLVVIDHHGATIYRDCSPGTVPEVVVPDDSEGHRRHLRTRREPTDGKRKPEQKSYYEAIAVKLIGAHQILIFGSGTGASSAMEHLCDELADHHATIATCVVGTVVVDSHHTSPNQLLAKASEFFSKLENPQPNLVKPKRLVTNSNSTS